MLVGPKVVNIHAQLAANATAPRRRDAPMAAFATFARERPDALFVSGDRFVSGRRVQLAQLAALHRLPATYPLRDYAEAGGLMSYQNTHWSARQIEPFIRKHRIDMDEFEPVDYRSFAEFFYRRLRPGVRQFPSASGEMDAFAEARYLAWDRVDAEQQFPVKGHSLSAEFGRADEKLQRSVDHNQASPLLRLFRAIDRPPAIAIQWRGR
jgi:hypothetical protein